MTAPDHSGVARGEFALLLPRKLTAGTWTHQCATCGRRSARFFTCSPCGGARSVTVEQAAAFARAS